MRAPHHAGTHQRRAAALVAAANADPTTRCWRCGHTLHEHKPHRNRTPAYWTAGHVRDGEINGELRPEASTCNYSAGATHGNRRRRRRWSRNW
jgi:hypothetical protein